jgi:hypothetical protein
MDNREEKRKEPTLEDNMGKTPSIRGVRGKTKQRLI